MKGGNICQACGRRFKMDLMVPGEIWEKITPSATKHGGLLCPTCIVERVENLFGFSAFFLTDVNYDLIERRKDIEIAALRKLTRFPKDMDAQVHWFCSNIMRILDTEQLTNLTKFLTERASNNFNPYDLNAVAKMRKK
jgi:hypothetical protein